MVGTPLARYFREHRGYNRGRDLFLFDIDPGKSFDDDVNRAEIVFICVPTPRASDGSARLDAVESALARIVGEKIVVVKSTVPPGTTEGFQKKYPQHKMLFNPEFLTEAHAWENTVNPDRQLVGYTEESKDAAATVLAILPQAKIQAPSPEYKLTATEAEIIKYAANVFLMRKITFANAVYDLAADLGADYEKIRVGLASDPRIGSSHLDVFHQGYRGYGGYCFTKDTDALIDHCKKRGLRRFVKLLSADRLFNEEVLKEQGLTPEDVSVHDEEWIKKKLEVRGKN